MGSEKHVQLAVRQSREHLFLDLGRHHAAEKSHLQREIVETVFEVRVMLLSQDCRRRKEGNLLSAHYGLESRTEGNLGLAVAHVSADETIHDMGAFHIVLDVLNTGQLILGLVIFELRLETELPVIVLVEGKPLAVLSSGIERYEFARKLLGTFSGFGLLVLPACGTELVHMRSFAGRSYVPLDQVGLLDGHIEVFLVGVLNLDVVTLTHTVDLQKDSDTVVDVYDVIAFMQLHEAVQSRALGVLQGLYNLLLAAEDLALTEDDEAFASYGESSGKIACFVVYARKITQHRLQTLSLNVCGNEDIDVPSVRNQAFEVLFEEREIAEIGARSVYVESEGTAALAADVKNGHRTFDIFYESVPVEEHLVRSCGRTVLLVGMAVEALGLELHAPVAAFKPLVSYEHEVVAVVEILPDSSALKAVLLGRSHQRKADVTKFLCCLL